MPSITPINSLPIPLLSDPNADITDAVSDYATAADSRLVPRFSTAAARDAAITAPVAGQLAAVTGTDELYVYRNSVWQGIAYRGIAKTTETQVVNNSTVFVNDDTLVLAVEANSTYVYKLILAYSSNTTADFKWTFSGPAGFGGQGNVFYLDPTSGGYSTIGAYAVASTRAVSGAGVVAQSEENGVLTVAGTAGNFRVTWAQNTANATDTVVKIGSFMQLLKVA